MKNKILGSILFTLGLIFAFAAALKPPGTASPQTGTTAALFQPALTGDAVGGVRADRSVAMLPTGIGRPAASCRTATPIS